MTTPVATHEFRPVPVRVRGIIRHQATCTCGWDDREHFALESSAWEAWDDHASAPV